MWRRLICGVVVSMVATLSTAHAQLNIIPQSKIQDVANPQTAHSEVMPFDNNGVVRMGTVSEDAAEWKGRALWRNVGDKPIAITRIQSSCSCLRASFDKRPVGSGKQGVIEVTFNPKGRLGGVEQRLFVYTTLSDKHPTAIVRLQGKVTPSADASGSYPHSCGTLLMMQKQVVFAPNGKQTERIAVMNGGSTQLRIRHDGRMSTPGLKAHTEPETLAPGQEGDLVVEYSPRKGNYNGPLMLYLEGVEAPPRGRRIEVVLRANETK